MREYTQRELFQIRKKEHRRSILAGAAYGGVTGYLIHRFAKFAEGRGKDKSLNPLMRRLAAKKWQAMVGAAALSALGQYADKPPKKLTVLTPKEKKRQAIATTAGLGILGAGHSMQAGR